MKILFVSSPSSLNSQIARSFIGAGHELIAINDHVNELFGGMLRNSSFIWSVLSRSSALKHANKRKINERIIKLAIAERPDLFFVTKGIAILPETLAQLRRMGVLTANWFCEFLGDPFFGRWYPANIGYYDYAFTFEPHIVQRYEGKYPDTRFAYVPLGILAGDYADVTLNEVDRIKYSCDVCFVGALYPERVRLLEMVAASKVDLRIYHWQNERVPPSLKSYCHGPITTKDVAKLYRCARVCLNQHLEPRGTGANPRTFEIAAAGGFQLSDHQYDIPNLFVPDKEIMLYQKPGDVPQLIATALADPERRAAIATAGQRRCLRDHTLDKRIRSIIETIG